MSSEGLSVGRLLTSNLVSLVCSASPAVPPARKSMSYAAVPPSPKKASAVFGPSSSARTSASSPLLEDAVRQSDHGPIANGAEDDLDIYEGGSATIFSAVSK